MRKVYIEYLRVIAMLMVIAIHTCTTAMTDFSGYSKEEGALFLCIRNIFHCAVPIFFMISGALMLPISKEMSLNKLIKKYLLKYGAVILIFGWGYSFAEVFFIEKTISISIFSMSLIRMIEGNSWSHMWYMYALFGTILLVPALRAIAESRKREQEFILISCFCFVSVIPCIEKLLNINIGVVFPISSIYCVYMLLGYYIDNYIFRKIDSKRLFYIGITILIITVLIICLTVLQIMKGYNLEPLFTYSSPIIFIYSAMIFGFTSVLNFKESSNVIRKLGEYSFGVYIIHMLWINILYKVLCINPFQDNALLGFVIIYL